MSSSPFTRLIGWFAIAFTTVLQGSALAAEPSRILARSYILVDGNSHRVLLQKNADERVQPASLTKMMTAYVVLDALQAGRLKWEQQVSVRATDIAHLGHDEATMRLQAGQVLSVQDLVTGLIVVSANDAAMVLARATAGTPEAFLTMMNQQAQRLGLKASHFATPSGITTRTHYSTARDIAELSMRLTQDFPVYLSFSSQREFTFGSFTKHNKNRLLTEDPSVDGLKTGHTAEAGYCLAVTSNRTLQQGHKPQRVFVVVLGAPTNDQRFVAAKQLINYGFVWSTRVQRSIRQWGSASALRCSTSSAAEPDKGRALLVAMRSRLSAQAS